jgi:hypothetical protein
VPKESTLSTAAAAHNNDCLTPMNVKRNVIEDRAVSELSDEVVDFDDGRVSGHDQNDE